MHFFNYALLLFVSIVGGVSIKSISPTPEFSIPLGFRALHNGKFLNTINWILRDRTPSDLVDKPFSQ
jgi:hypothetical protein